MNTAGTITFCTLASIIILIAAVQCYRIWRQDKQLKKHRRANSDQTTNATADLENNGGGGRGGGGGGGASTGLGNEQSGEQAERRLELTLPSAWSAYSARRPGSGYEGLEVVSPDMVQRRDFATASDGPQAQQWSGENWIDHANSTTHTQQGQSAMPEKFHNPAPAHHNSSGLLQPSSSLIAASRSPSPVSAIHNPAQLHVGPSMQHQVQRTEVPVSIHSAHSSVEIASTPQLSDLPRDHQVGPLQLDVFSTSLELMGSGGTAGEANSTIQELESPLQPVSVCSEPVQTNNQPQYRAYSPHLSTEGQEQSTLKTQSQQGREVLFHSRPSAPIHSHSSSLPTTGRQQAKAPHRRDDHQQVSNPSKAGRFSLNALTALPIGKRWSWNPRDDAAFWSNARDGDA